MKKQQTTSVRVMNNDTLIRLNKFISSAGHAARRKADELIQSGRVSVNSRTVTEPGRRIDPEKDTVKVDGETIRQKSRFTYILLNKPRGYITTTSDEKNRPTVLDLVKVKKRIFPVGRLDYDSEGLLLLTDDGELSNRLMHPRFEVWKTYIIRLNKPIDDKSLKKISSGVVIDGIKTQKSKVSVLPGPDNRHIKISIHEGRNRQVRKMLESVGFFVRRLKRVEYAGLTVAGLKPGSWRYLDQKEIAGLKKHSGLA